MEKKDNCLCNSGDHMVMACSGASDVGYLTDIVARKLRDDKVYKMTCLALVGAGIESSINGFKENIPLVIDGCPVDCGKKIMAKNGIDNYAYIRLSDLGLNKGESPANKKNIDVVYQKAASMV